MYENNRKEKWLALVILFVLAIIAFLLFLGINAQAKNVDKIFIPIQEIITKNGLKIWHIEDNSLPIIAVKFMFKDSGTALDPKNQQGLARMLSNTMDEGAAELNSNDFQKLLSNNSITLRFNTNRDAFSGNLITLTRNKDMAFDLLKKAINEPRFDDEPVLRMRDANISRIKSSISNPDWITARIMNDVAFQNHPYAQNSGGTISGLSSISSKNLKDFKNSFITKDKIIIATAGDITPDDLSNKIDDVFANLPNRKINNSISNTTLSNSNKVYLFKKDIPQTFIEIMLPTFDERHPDHYTLQILNYIYGGAGFGSRLMAEAREKNGLTYGIYSSLQNFDYADTMRISTSTKNESAKKMLDIIKDEMIKLQTELVGEKELNDAKSYIIGSMPLALKSTSDLAGIALSLQFENKPIDYLDTYADKINAVNAYDIQRLAKTILNPSNMVTVLVGKPENIDNTHIIESLPNVE